MLSLSLNMTIPFADRKKGQGNLAEMAKVDEEEGWNGLAEIPKAEEVGAENIPGESTSREEPT